ncbi:NifU family protein [Thermopolyspora sp. NPDC052614]|uniref:NifU family protein n=1 Tax=Thermopolyspora sp. NPDC052614 TaxID=3155682 RepID=UPI00343D6D85
MQAGQTGSEGAARGLPTSSSAPPAGESGERSAPGETDALRELAGKVDEAVRRVAELDGPAREAAEELRRAVEAVHRAGLVTIVRRMRADDRARELLFELVDEPEVRMLLMLHGIIRPDPVTEATRVLAGIRPWMRSQNSDAELVRIEDGVAYIRVEGASRGCSSAAPDLAERVATVLTERVGAISRVEVLPAEPTPTFIPLTAIGRGPGADTSGVSDNGTGGATR